MRAGVGAKIKQDRVLWLLLCDYHVANVSDCAYE